MIRISFCRSTFIFLIFAYFLVITDSVDPSTPGSCVKPQRAPDGEIIYRISDGKAENEIGCQKRLRPPNKWGGPTVVHVSLFVYFLGSVEAQNLQFTAHILIQYRWNDSRLIHESGNIEGETKLKEQIWTPHLYLVNEHESKVMGSDKDDVLISIHPDGTVYYATRLKVTLLCFMNLQKFPFDDQECPLVLESWGYNTSQLLLKWEKTDPVRVNNDLKLTEYTMDKFFTNASVANYSAGKGYPNFGGPTLYHSKFAGNYSSLSVYFELSRQVGHYIMDYYVPSVLLVVVSWVSFWLDPNAVPGRTTLGTSTMLTFITLSRNIGSSLPKVSYIKATEIWFIVCTAFIFGSLVEFAFVNTIWRRRKTVELKKINSKHILKSTLTPTLKRRDIQPNFDRSVSCNSLDDSKFSGSTQSKFGSQLTVSTIDTVTRDGFQFSPNPIAEVSSITVPEENMKKNKHFKKKKDKSKHDSNKGFFTMTPQEIAQWIDKRSRVVFPLLFLIFNILYWIFVYVT